MVPLSGIYRSYLGHHEIPPVETVSYIERLSKGNFCIIHRRLSNGISLIQSVWNCDNCLHQLVRARPEGTVLSQIRQASGLKSLVQFFLEADSLNRCYTSFWFACILTRIKVSPVKGVHLFIEAMLLGPCNSECLLRGISHSFFHRLLLCNRVVLFYVRSILSLVFFLRMLHCEGLEMSCHSFDFALAPSISSIAGSH